MKPTTLSADRIEVRFDTSPPHRVRIRNRGTGATVCRGGEQSILVRTPDDISEPVFLNRVTFAGGNRMTASDRTGRYRARLSINPSPEGLRFHLRVSAPKPLWIVEWKLAGLAFDEVIVPALGGQSLSNAMPRGVALAYKYPFWWNAQFVIGAQSARGGGGGVSLSVRDPGPGFKLLRVKKEAKGFALSLGFEAPGSAPARTLEATWYLDGYSGSWKIPVDRYREWMENAFGLTPLDINAAVPGWARGINFILEMWGMRKDQPQPHLTFDEMKRRLTEWKRLHHPAQTLVYLPGFANQGIDSRAPDYTPSPYLGGEKKFKQLVDAAHRLGYRVMIHTNVLAMTFNHPLFRRFRRHQVVDCFGRPQSWGLDIDGDWLFEPYFAYINPGVTAWSRLMTGILGDLVRKYAVDGVFIDQTLLAFNVRRGPNFIIGMRDHIRRLHRAFPEVLFAGEGLHEQVVSELPVAQIHGLDSINEVHALGTGARWRNVHPVSTYLFGRYTTYVAHLLTRHPSHPEFAMQERAYRRLGVIPALCLYDRHERLDGPDVRAMIKRAKSLRSSRTAPGRRTDER